MKIVAPLHQVARACKAVSDLVVDRYARIARLLIFLSSCAISGDNLRSAERSSLARGFFVSDHSWVSLFVYFGLVNSAKTEVGGWCGQGLAERCVSHFLF